MNCRFRRNLSLGVLVFVLLFSSLVQAAPERIISLAPSITEILFALGVGEQVVGVTSWCTYPAEAQEKAIIGDAFNLNLELLLGLEPDLVIGDSTLVQNYLEQLQAFGLEVLTISPSNLAEIQESLITLGEQVGFPRRGQELAEAMEARLEELTERGQREIKPRVFVEIWHEPLMSAGPGSFLHELVVLAGAENIAADTDDPWPTISEELVIERDPQVVILTGFNKEEVMARPSWQILKALQTKSVYEVDPDLYARSTPRLLDALEELITILDGIEP